MRSACSRQWLISAASELSAHEPQNGTEEKEQHMFRTEVLLDMMKEHGLEPSGEPGRIWSLNATPERPGVPEMTGLGTSGAKGQEKAGLVRRMFRCHRA